MPLLRGLAKTAAVAGTASAVAGRVRRRQDAKFAKQDAAAAPEPAPAAPAPAPAPTYAAPAPAPTYAAPASAPTYAAPASAPAPPTTADRLEQLKSLGELKDAGVLTEAEFQAQKAKILAG
ncbi:putative oligomerization/nucleic acid binding protein [Kribbella rubisoli]|uniref:Oligomerization/nucleic acid binding protein n=1 Tax=Kribbella rubisoli TaxID=3075929 RepID=A0A4Q7WMC4_9ACTN|nr:SHOCT domain-containing protein [Kribbella rubisoli]RZU11267.1 putative oligomerization/nucleic acid binding protein [Kribbella rubisoli]